MSARNGRQIGQAHLATLEFFLATGAHLPVSPKDGTLNLTQLSKTTGIPKSSFYQNPSVKERLEAARHEQGLVRQGELQTAPSSASGAHKAVKSESNKSSAILEMRLHQLEQKNATLATESFELRRQLNAQRLQLGREDMMIETGRRVPVPPEST